MLANKVKTGVAQINFELPPELLDELKAFAEARGQTLKYVMQRALRRHMDTPPPLVPDPPLEPGAPEPGGAPEKPRRVRKPKK